MINPIALKILQLFPLPNQPGIGAGGLTNNYQREETRHVDRDNYDVKLNWNRTSAHQIWGKFSFMNAVVDDLTNYLGPGSERRGRRRIHQGLSVHDRPDVDAEPDAADGHDVRVLAAEAGRARPGLQRRELRPRRARHSGHERSGDRRPALCRLSRSSTPGFSAVGNRDGWNPIFRDERTYSIAHQHHEDQGAPRHPRRLLPELPLPRSLAAGDRQPARPLHVPRQHDRRSAAARRRTSTTSTRRSCSARSATSNKSVQNELMTSREWQHALYVRDRWNVNSRLTLDLGLRWEFYPIMHTRRRPRHRSARSRSQRSTSSSRGAAATRRPTGWRPAWTTSRRASAASTASTTRRSCARGYGLTYNAQAVGASRCAATTTTR